jgi:hypothetical protein
MRKMNNVNTDSIKDNNSTNPELVAELQKVVVKINDVFQHPNEVEYFVDLVSDGLIQQYGRELVTQTIRFVLNKSTSPELSKKLTGLRRKFDRKYFHGWTDDVEVEVRYCIGQNPRRDSIHLRPNVITMSASSEPFMVTDVLEQLITEHSGTKCWDCYQRESNRVYGSAPLPAGPSMRHLTAEEYMEVGERYSGTPEVVVKPPSDAPEAAGEVQS